MAVPVALWRRMQKAGVIVPVSIPCSHALDP